MKNAESNLGKLDTNNTSDAKASASERSDQDSRSILSSSDIKAATEKRLMEEASKVSGKMRGGDGTK